MLGLKGRMMCGIYAIFIGLLYMVAATGEITGWIQKDLIGGVMLIVISVVYIYGGKKFLQKGDFAFIVGGVFLSLIYGFLYLSIAFADYLEYLIDIKEFILTKELRIEIWLMLASSPLMYKAWKNIRKLKW